MIVSQKISPCLWFDHQGEEAAELYVSLFPHSRIINVSRTGETEPGKPGKALMVQFELSGTKFQALNGGPHFKFTEAISLSVSCADQGEVDHLWGKLGAGGSYSRCGWLKDRYGLSWQIVPAALPRFIGGPDAAGAKRAMQAMMQMGKLDIAVLEAAYQGR